MRRRIQNLERELRQRADTQQVISELLKLSLDERPLDEILARALERILSIDWLTLEKRGALFLVAPETRTLVMKAQSNLSEELLSICKEIPFGYCMCGRAAETGELTFSNHIDSRHDVTLATMKPHGHYCVPISTGGDVLGVMTTYVKQGHARSAAEEAFLMAVANTLAGIILRRRLTTEKEALQAHLLRLEQRAALGRMAEAIAHDFNNILSGILGHADIALETLPPESGERGEIEAVAAAAERAADLVDRIRFFSRGTSPERTPIALAPVIGEALAVVRGMVPPGIRLETLVTENDVVVVADPTQVHRIVLNLCTNAIQAMVPGQGLLRVSFDAWQVEHEHDASVPPGDYARLVVQDSGCGMSPETQAHIFEPYFTTKRDGEGTGLGLATTYDIVVAHGGTLLVESSLGKGSTFTVVLPCAGGSTRPPGDPTTA